MASFQLPGGGFFVDTVEGGTVPLSGGAFLTGEQPVIPPVIIEVPSSTLTLTAYEPTIRADESLIFVPASTMTLTAYVPTIVNNVTIQVPHLLITMTAWPPTVRNETFYQIPSSSMTMTAYPPTVLTTSVTNDQFKNWILQD